MANQSVWNPNWKICILWKNTSISLAAGRDLSIVRRGGPSILLMALHLISLGTNDEALQWFRMNQNLNYLLRKGHAVRSDGGKYT